MTATAYDPLMLDLFRVELENHTRTLEAGLVEAEREQSPERIEPLMRAAHSIKGAARIVGLNHAVSLAHAMEDVLSAAQQGKRPLEPEGVDLLLKGNDLFAALARLDVAELPTTLEKEAASIQTISEDLRAFLKAPPSARDRLEMTAKESRTAPPQQEAVPESIPTGTAPSSPAQPQDSSVPSHDPSPAANVCSPVLSEGLATRLHTVSDPGEGGLVRVRSENMNHLMALAGESLVQTQSIKAVYANLQLRKKALTDLEKPLRQAMETSDAEEDSAQMTALREALNRLGAIQETTGQDCVQFERLSRRLEHLAHRLYNEVIASRMVPFSDGLHGFSRLVRDLARQIGKAVRFDVAGASTPVDRDILERLEAPLSHLIRNAIDHGMETPQERSSAGKPAEGTLLLEARHAAGMLHISIADDGRGIDPETLRGKVIEKGYVTQEMAVNLSRAELFEFLFLPGFSTAGAVTEISGRGVGLDVVFNMAHEVGGTVRVDSETGRGTRFQLQLPLTLSVLRTLLVEIADEPYALPLSRIDRVLAVSSAHIREVEDCPFCTLDGEHVGVVDARQLFRLPPGPGAEEQHPVVVISDRLNRYGLAVDRIIREENLVVRPLDQRLGKVPNISAAAILDDGTPVVIFDVDDLVRSVHQLLTAEKIRKIGAPDEGKEKKRKRVLVVDDSLTVREVERRLLENAGYDVTAALDGVDGWNTLAAHPFDLVVTDVDMPRMNGIELVRAIKADPLLRELPVMIVSYKDREEDRLRGLEAGADYYLTKGSFHDEGLLTAVRDLIGAP